MARNRRTEGIILRSRRFGEYHKSLEILSAEEGLFQAIAYGALKGKSRLAGVSEPFVEGEMYLYHDPVRDRFKLSEVDVRDRHDGLREDLDRYYIASFWVEFVIKSFAGGGEFVSLYSLLHSALSTLERTVRYDAITVHFIWRYLDLLGLRPDLSHCARCGSPLAQETVVRLGEEGFTCYSCAEGGGGALDEWGRDFLLRSAGSSFARIEEYLGAAEAGESRENRELQSRELEKLKRILLHLVQDVVERPLNSLNQGIV